MAGHEISDEQKTGPCHFCGADTKFHVYKSERGEDRLFYVCEKCEEVLNS